ncbi:MAG: DUF2160 family membrane protein [Trueperaceae bacterium]|nr:DUF2160 family membrane protein [Trueperaceae bacterium]
MDLSWMEWTWPTAIFLILLAAGLTVMSIWDMYVPSVKRKGFLPIPFTRGERFFISIVVFFAVMLLWLTFSDASLWYPLAIALIIDVIIARYG